MRNENQKQYDIREELIEQSEYFARHEGRRPRLMIASLGQGLKAEIIKKSNQFADLGFDVDIAPVLDEVQPLMQQVIDNDVHILLVLISHADLKKYQDQIVRASMDQWREEVLLVFQSEDELEAGAFEQLKGTGSLFSPGASVCDLAKYMLDAILGKD